MADLATDLPREQDSESAAPTRRVSLKIVATLLGGTLLLCAFLARFLFRGEPHADILAILAAILLGGPLVLAALRDLLRGQTQFNSLVALAIVAAFVNRQYLESGTVAFFMLIAVLIESRTALGAQASVESLIRITPRRAHRLTGDTEQEVDARQLRPGDVVRVRPGDNIPADGEVVSGASTVNQAPITGESIPVDKAPGDEVFSGTINVTGLLDIRVTKAGEDTTLGRVKSLILQAEATRIPILRLIDRYSSWYTPTVVMLVAVVFFVTMRSDPAEAWERAIAMLVAACPVALILATPTAMVAALSAAARRGGLVKRVVHLESARNLTAMIFDKTGTLTTGELQVTRLMPLTGVEPADLLTTAASLEQNSRHPVARAIVEVARRARLTLGQPQDFAETSGRGVSGRVDGQVIRVGRATWLAETDGLGAAAAADMQRAVGSPEAEGLSLLFVARGKQLLGWIGLADNTRPQAAAAMDRLRQLGLKRLFIVTGDRESVAKRVAAQMHTEYRAEVLPQEKLHMVDELRRSGHRVAVVGDGVNDAPALAAGAVSIAMGAAGSDVALHSASIALMNNNLSRIPFLIDLSRTTYWVILQNLAFGLGFIVVFVALAMGGWISAWLTAALNLLGGLIVVFNSARLVRSGEDVERQEAEGLQEPRTASRGWSAAGVETAVGVPA